MPDTQFLTDEAAAFLARYPKTAVLDALYADLCGHIRGKRFPITQIDKVMTEGLATPVSVFLLDAKGEGHDPLGLGFSDGDPDSILKVIPGSLAPVPWLSDPTAQAMVTFLDHNGAPHPLEPRNVLRKVVERLAGLKLRPVVAFELEFYLIDRERLPDGAPQPPISPVTGKRLTGTQVYRMSELDAFPGLLKDITDSCAAQGIETGAVTTEYAPGQFEINLQHLDDPLKAADQCCLFKRVVRAVALKHGVEATFMAKPYADTSGSGLHMHCSLLDDKGRNVFSERTPGSLNKTLRHAMGGILDLFGDAMAILAPTINSYRRFQPNIYVPISPCWAMENRSVALRVPTGDKAARRIEHRIAGADANPYLVLATMLAGILHGMENKINPGPPSQGNAGQAYHPDIPFRPRRALDSLRESKVLADYLGARYLEAYCACKEAEFDRFDSVISPAEYDWYLQTE